ncbi:MAG TPA: hypothetical protein VJU87_06985, partial [Gemmatimonadaceae bacterium]|nr:hypothetical protein [Gemmatimonadaceae bacterium]
MTSMNRRDALKTTGLLLGGVLVATSGVLAGCAHEARPAPARVLARDDERLMADIADTLLPA